MPEQSRDTGSDVSNCNVEMVILRSEFNSQDVFALR